MSLIDDVRAVVRGEVEDSKEMLDAYARDTSLFFVRPEVAVHPQDAQDIAALVELATKQKQENPKSNISLTARSAGTDMSGGPLNNSIIVDMTKHLNHLVELGGDYAVVEPGMYFRDFDAQTQKKNLELPSYTASREINTVGGMAANNSGGEKNLKYGKTARYVEELDVVLGDGHVHTLKYVTGDALRAKCAEDGYEGELYRAMSKLVLENKDLIQEHKPTVEKNSSGYAVWDIGDGKESLNLARLMVGAQGTLGIITKIRFKLVHPKPYSAMTVVFLKNLSELGSVVPQVLIHKPDSFESYDDHTFSLGTKYFPEFAKQMKGNLFTLAWAFLPEMWMVLTGGVPKFVLMAEFRADTQEQAITQAEDLMDELEAHDAKLSVRVARSEKQARKYWVIRHESFNLLRKKIRGMRTAPFIDDFVVPPVSLPDFLPKLEEILSHYNLIYTVQGHVGDGNFHIIPLVNPKQPNLARTIDEL